MTNLPRLIEPNELEAHLDKDNLIIVDLCNPSLYQHKHVPGAVHLSGSHLLAGVPPVPGACPSIEQLKSLINHLGIDASKQIVVYDDDGGGWAGRLAWTLDLLGLPNWSYLNGGIVPWIKEGFVTEAGTVQPWEKWVVSGYFINTIFRSLPDLQPERRQMIWAGERWASGCQMRERVLESRQRHAEGRGSEKIQQQERGLRRRRRERRCICISGA